MQNALLRLDKEHVQKYHMFLDLSFSVLTGEGLMRQKLPVKHVISCPDRGGDPRKEVTLHTGDPTEEATLHRGDPTVEVCSQTTPKFLSHAEHAYQGHTDGSTPEA